MRDQKKIYTKKVGMTQVWKDEKVIPATILAAEGNESMDLKEGEKVTIRGISKGKGFQGVVKRHGFGGGPKTHGQKDRHRAPGSIGPTAPQRVIKGRRMAGHMGLQRITLKHVTVLEVRQDTKKILVTGAVPGARGTKIEIQPQ